jgi:hypothetical protein
MYRVDKQFGDDLEVLGYLNNFELFQVNWWELRTVFEHSKRFGDNIITIIFDSFQIDWWLLALNYFK